MGVSPSDNKKVLSTTMALYFYDLLANIGGK